MSPTYAFIFFIDVPETSLLAQNEGDKVEERQGLVRSTSDILSLIKKREIMLSSVRNHSVASHCINTQNHQGTPLPESKKSDEICDGVPDQGSHMSSLGQTHRNVLKPSLCEPYKRPSQRLDVLPEVLIKQVRPWKKPQVNCKLSYSALARGEKQEPQQIK